MKNAVKIGIMIFFILVVVRSSYSQYSVSGTVRYSDDNSVVTTGNVKAYLQNGTLAFTTNIQSNGTYTFISLGENQYDLIGIANHDEDNFIPTYYPDKNNPQLATIINPSSDMYNIDIYVTRVTGVHNAFTAPV